MLASTYLGGSGEERYAYEGFGGHIYTGDRSIARDASGNIYVLAETLSSNFPITGGVYDGTYNDASSYLKNDIVISKFSPGLDTLLASTFLGGTSEDNASGLAVDASGNLYVTGFTRSMDFPVVNGNHDITFNGGPSDVFVSKLSGDLSQLLASTYLGGRKTEAAYSIVLDGAGSLYVAGDSSSDNFPVRSGGYQSAVSGATDGFVAKFTADLTTLSHVTLLGGSGEDYLRGMVRDTSGTLYVVGSSASSNYPTTVGAYDRTQNSRLDVLVSALGPDLGNLISSTFVGHSYDDLAYAVALNSAGDVIVAGMTESPSYPTTVGAYDQTHNGTYDAFVTKFGPGLDALKQSTFLGGTNWEDVYAIGLDNTDQVYITGLTRSSNYPTSAEAYRSVIGGTSDGFIAKLSANLATLEGSTLMGGAGHLDAIVSFVFDGAWDLLSLAVTNSADFPTTPGAYDSSANGNRDLAVFVITKDLLSDASSNHLELSDSLGNKNISVIAGSSTLIKVSVLDQYGNVLPSYNGDYSVTLGGPGTPVYGNSPTCTNKAGAAIELGNATNLAFNRGVATCTLRVYKAEVTELDASITSTLRSHNNALYDLDLTVNTGAFSATGSMLSASPTPGVVTQLETLLLDVRDLYGNALGAAASGQTVQFSVTGANVRSINATDLGNGTYQGSYTPGSSGYDVIMATINASGVGSDPEGARDGILHLTINALGLDHFEVRYEAPVGTFNNVASFQTGASSVLTLFARDSLGNNVMDYDGWKSITLSGPSPAPYGSPATCLDLWGVARPLGSGITLNFVDGKATCSFVARKVENASVDATDGYITSYGAVWYDLDLNVGPDVVTHLTITGSNTQVAGVPQLITIRAKDQFGNVHGTYNGDRYLTFSGVTPSFNGTPATVRDKSNTAVAFGAQATITFAAGVATSNMALYTRGIWSVDVTDGTSSTAGSSDYDLDVPVSSTGSVAAAESTIDSNSNPVGNCGVVVPIITARDAYGNQLETGGHTVVVTVAGVNAGSPTVVDNLNGSYFADYPPTNSGTDSITAQINGVPVGKDSDGTSNGTYVQVVNPEAMNTATWLGTTSSAWDVAANWQGGVVPTSCYDVIINGGYTNPPILNHAVSGRVVLRNLTLGSTVASTLTVSNAGSTNYLQVRENMTVGGFGTLSHTANGSTATHQLWLVVDGNLSILIGGKIDAQGRGYATPGSNWSSGYGPGAGQDITYGSGGTHAGLCSYFNTGPCPGSTYGSISQPTALGSSGGRHSGASGEGGGAIRVIVKGTMLLNGSILVDGNSAPAWLGSGGGSGGSAWIEAHAFQGNGPISASGGNGTGGGGTYGAGGAGGGRVAIYYDSSTYLGSITAFGGTPANGGSWAGAGTIYLKDRVADSAQLIVRNNNHLGVATRGIAGDSYTFSRVDIDSGGYYSLVNGQYFSTLQNSLSIPSGTIYLEAGSAFAAPNITAIQGAGGTLNIQATAQFSAANVASLNGVSLYNYDKVSFPLLTSINAIRFENHGIYNHSGSTLNVSNTSTWVENGTRLSVGDMQTITDVIVDNSTLEYRNQTAAKQLTLNSLEVRNNGVLTHAAAAENATSTLNIAATTLTLQPTGKIDVAGRGYLFPSGGGAGTGPGGGLLNGQGGGSGGTHAGLGGFPTYGAGTSNTNTYGSISMPIYHGSSGAGTAAGGGTGGGAVRLKVTGTLLLDGRIIVDGTSLPVGGTGGGGGSGGSVWIDASTLSGSGLISSNGKDGGTKLPEAVQEMDQEVVLQTDKVVGLVELMAGLAARPLMVLGRAVQTPMAVFLCPRIMVQLEGVPHRSERAAEWSS